MNQAELTGIISSNPKRFAWFIGAGASATAGLPTATDVLWDLKRRYYCQEENQEYTRQDVQNSAVAAKIQAFMESRGFPKQWAADEYPTYFDKIFGDDKERQRKYLAGKLSEKNVQLSVGCRVLAALMHSGNTEVVFTTNFDSVVEKAVAEVTGSSLSAYHLEGTGSAKNAFNNREFPFYCKLHGDFRFDSIKNLSQDLATQNTDLSACLINAANQYGFVIAGYSGRDASVMQLFERALEFNNPYPGGLFWTGLKGSKPAPAVASLLEKARAKGVQAEFVDIETYDTFLLRLWRNLDSKPKELDTKVRRTRVRAVNISLPSPGQRGAIYRTNALPILELPEQCYEVKFRMEKSWDDVKAAQRKSEGSLILTRSEEVLAWGQQDDIRDTFSDIVSLQAHNLPSIDELADNLNIKRFIEEALCKALVRDRPLLTRRTRNAAYIIVDAHHEDRSVFEGLEAEVGKMAGELAGVFSEPTDFHPERKKLAWAEGLRVSVDVRFGRLWALITPDLWIWPNHARKQAATWMQERRKWRFNQKHNDIMDAWISLILGDDTNQTEIRVSAFDDGQDHENPSFMLGRRTAYSKGV